MGGNAVTLVSTAAGASMLAHGVHYAVIAAGLAGLGVLLLPQALHRSAGTAAWSAVPTASPAGDREAALLLPLVVVGSTAAAGVHAVMTPPHLAELPLFGVFFGVCAAAQLTWVVLVLVAPSRAVLRAGVVGNAALLALWATTRVVGMEPVGAWDLGCAAWEIGVTAGAVLLLRTPTLPRMAPLTEWRPTAYGWLTGTVCWLAVLTLTGVGR